MPSFILLAALWAAAELHRSSWNTGQWVERQQPIQFSHKHHTGDDGIDCRYCHTSVEISASAGMPSTETCMNCHKQIWADSPISSRFAPALEVANRLNGSGVHDLPDYSYFNHSIHVNKGVGCSTCHGRVDQMPIAFQAQRCKWNGVLAVIVAPRNSSDRRTRFSTWSGDSRTGPAKK